MIAMIGEELRRYGFWLFDAISGGEVRKFTLDMEERMEGRSNAQLNDLSKLLDHAVDTVPFYHPFRGYANLSDFPIIKKSLIKEQYDRFLSSAYINKPLFKVKTSGSTGERFVMLQDKQKRKRVVAELFYFLDRCGIRPGCPYIDAKIWHDDNRRTRLAQMARNMKMFDCSSLNEESLQRLYAILRKGRGMKCFTGYATYLSSIALEFDRRGYTPDMFDVELVVSGAERLEPAAKALLKKVFGCPVVSRYANNENGFLGQQEVDSEDFVLNTAHYFFEMLCLDSDDPAPASGPARLILTDIYNRAMPLIRYNTGDIVFAERFGNEQSGKLILTELSGRQDEVIYDTRGNKICPHFVALKFRSYDRLPQFQLIQESLETFTLNLEGAAGVYLDEDFVQTVRQLVGPATLVKIRHMEKIPHLSSGKFKKVICNIKTGSTQN